jgi:REP element-mobilizing transposase RayT
MPEHVHLLISVPEGTSMKDFVRRFKQTSGFALKKQLGSEAWQVSYYDRILRVDESAEDVARYIWNNPIEDGLVEDASEYPWNGPREFIS